MAPPILALKGITAGFGDPMLFQDLDVYVSPGERIALVGRNGSGKSTMLKIMAGLQEAESGERFVQPGTSVAYLGQEVDLTPYPTVGDYVEKMMGSEDATAYYRVQVALSSVGIAPDRSTTGLSGGETRRVALAGAFVQDPDVLLLDEPTNHLDIPSIEWLEDSLKNFPGAIVTVSHDRAFLKHLSRITLWLERGAIHRLEKGYQHFEQWAETIIELETVETAKLDKLITEETRWSREGISARRTRNQGRLRRLDSLRSERRARTSVAVMGPLQTDSGKVSGRLVAEASQISKSYGDLTLVDGFSTKIMRGDRIGIIGPNGAGKTTLLKMLTGELAPDSGSIRLGTNLDVLVFDQTRATLDPEATLWDTLCDMGGDQVNVRGRPKHVVGYLKEFLFHPGQARSPIKSLSGGEKNRLLLAKHLARPSNLMILDEPTNDLDIETLDLLEDMLGEYTGTVLLVSHDRDFLDRVVTSTIALEGKGQVHEYPGGYSDFLIQSKSKATETAEKLSAKATSISPEKSKKNTGRLSYKDKRELEDIPKRMSVLETKIDTLNGQLSAAGNSSSDIHSLSEKLGMASTELADLEERWLELEMLKEDLES